MRSKFVERRLGVCRLCDYTIKANRESAHAGWKLGPVRLFSAVGFSSAVAKIPRVTSASHVRAECEAGTAGRSRHTSRTVAAACWRDPFLGTCWPCRHLAREQLPDSSSSSSFAMLVRSGPSWGLASFPSQRRFIHFYFTRYLNLGHATKIASKRGTSQRFG